MENNYDVIICPYNIKKEIIKKNQLIKSKFITIEEFKEKYLYKYKRNTILYLYKKYNILPSNAKIIMDNLYYIKNISKKTKQLLEIKEDLIKNNYLIFDNNFITFIKNKTILVIGYPKTKEIELLLNNLNVTYFNEEVNEKEINIYEFTDIDSEVTFVANKIVELLINKVDINKIKIVKNEDIYDGVINRIFNIFNLPFVLNTISLYNLTSVKEIINNLPTKVSELIDKIKISNLKDDLKNQLLLILGYLKDEKIKDIYDILIYELKNTKIKYNYHNFINIIDINEIEKDDIVFILGFNQDVFPKLYIDNDYLTDLEKESLNLDTSTLNNKVLKEKIKKILYQNNIYLTYKLKTPFNTYTISNLYEELNYKIIKEKYDYSNLKLNRILLGQKLDEFIKYNFKDEELINLYSTTEINYNTYNNKYKKIKYDLLKENIKELNLSFSNIDVFYKCKFRFYLENILKIKKNKETVSLEIGNLFHKVLEKYYQENKDILDIIKEVLNKENKNAKEKFYYQKYEKLLLELINIMNEQLENTSYKATFFEKWFSINKDNDLNIKVVGKIDKIMTFNDNDNTYVLVIDYKTGLLHADFNKAIYGMDMQLLLYLYLIKNTNVIKNPIFTGMYLEPILSNVLKQTDGKTYKELLKNEYKWVGYTIDNIKRVSEIDKNYEINSFIKGLRVKSDNTFYVTSKVIDEIKLDKLIEIVENNIDNVITSIKKCDFAINPKKLGGSNVSCTYCPYKDICFMTNNDIINLKEYKKLEFL